MKYPFLVGRKVPGSRVTGVETTPQDEFNIDPLARTENGRHSGPQFRVEYVGQTHWDLFDPSKRVGVLIPSILPYCSTG